MSSPSLFRPALTFTTLNFKYKKQILMEGAEGAGGEKVVLLQMYFLQKIKGYNE